MISAASARPSPAPPYSVGMRAPSQPAAVSARTNRSGYSLLRSSSRQYSSGNSAHRERTAERIDSCSSVRPKSTATDGAAKAAPESRSRRRRSLLRLGEVRLGSVRSRRDHERACGDEDDGPVLFDPALADRDDAPALARARLTRLEYLGVRVERVALEQRARQRHLADAQRKSPAARLLDHQPRDRGQREEAVHQRALEFRLRRVVRVEVDLVRIVREQRELDVVGLGDRATDG